MSDVGVLREAPAYGIIDPDYARVFTVARCIAWSEGYALLMHGSFTRDLDLLAVPWTEQATDAEHLVKRIGVALDDLDLLVKDPKAPSQASEKPHGRRAWTFTFKTFGDPRFVDLSVMPMLAAAEADIAALRTRAEEAEALVEYWKATAEDEADIGNERKADRDRLAERVKVLEAALKPFGDAADAYPVSPVPRREDRRRREVVWSYGSEDAGNRREITVTDLRAANRALTSTEGGSSDV